MTDFPSTALAATLLVAQAAPGHLLAEAPGPAANAPLDPAPARRAMTVEELLRWVYRDELPKTLAGNDNAGAPGYPSISPMFRMAALGVSIDNWSRDPGFPVALGETHPDAMRVARVVDLLVRYDALDVSGYAVDHGMEGFRLDVAAAVARARASARQTLISRAVLGRAPDSGAEGPVCAAAKGDNGQVTVWQVVLEAEATVGGGTVDVERVRPVAKAQRRGGYYPTGSHSRLAWEPRPASILEERAEYAIWIASLEALYRILVTDELVGSIEVLPPAAPPRPWISAPAPRRVLPDASSSRRVIQAHEEDLARKMLARRRRGQAA